MDLNKVENLALLSKKGDIKAKEELAEEFKPLILNLAKKSHIQGFDFEDIKNACYESLFRCLKIYDTSRHRFVAYATTSIKNSVESLIRTSNRKSRIDGKEALILNDVLENTLSCDMGFVEERIVKDMAAAKIRKAVKNLSYEEQDSFLELNNIRPKRNCNKVYIYTKPAAVLQIAFYSIFFAQFGMIVFSHSIFPLTMYAISSNLLVLSYTFISSQISNTSFKFCNDS